MTANNQAYLSSIYIYPIKSTHPISINRSWVTEKGLIFDRNFMLSDDDHNMITAREHPSLLHVKTLLTYNGLMLTHPDADPINLDHTQFELKPFECSVWGTHFIAYTTNKDINLWFEKILGKKTNLLFLGKDSNRIQRTNQKQLSFADGAPLLLISQASLDKLNQYSPRINTMLQFRPNIVVSNTKPFEEDSWDTIKIGSSIFKIESPCERCLMTTHDLADLKQKHKEPLKTLAQFRRGSSGGVFFGQNVIVEKEGSIEAGDTINIIKTKPKESYINRFDN